MLKMILLSAAAILVTGVVIVLILAAMKPDSFTVRRSLAINAPPERIFPLINEFRNWTQWSPWEKLDPALKRDYSGAPTGIGSVYAWDGDKKVGQGRMEIVEAASPKTVGLKLDFVRPFEAHNNVIFALEPAASGTNVTWTMTGPVPFVAKIFHVFMNMDRVVGGDFETGLANMKAAAER
ncbi:polyketide cyclase [Bosea caraganae]|uniref:Polyketide cyclase n=1 Tax=Bosea caraganae TaxID=2763117 RepID=A0A370L8Q8_9HYPH|nr:SRPBCC family protein [Bosea caraganae]RDJ26771.1 polyketide cyclase [Bosea caraganae]RDJ30658.1 polyketide cyclase [Bosea caraganae]